MSDLTKLLISSDDTIYRGSIYSIKEPLYGVKIGSKEVYAELSVDDTPFIGQSVVLAKTKDNYFIVGIGASSAKTPTVIEIDG